MKQIILFRLFNNKVVHPLTEAKLLNTQAKFECVENDLQRTVSGKALLERGCDIFYVFLQKQSQHI